MIVVHLPGRTPYLDAHALQRRCVDARSCGAIDDTVLLLEHEPTLTVGRARGAARNVHDPRGMPVIEVERGGDVTWHGPGQLVAYPIVRLDGPRADLHQHLRCLEAAMIDVVGTFGVAATRDARNSGAWVDGRKIGSVGIACRRWVTWHGLALNVGVDLAVYEAISPCGFPASIMTSLHEHVRSPLIRDPHRLVPRMAEALADALDLPWDGAIRSVAEAAIQ